MLGKYKSSAAIALSTLLAFSTLFLINPKNAKSAATHVVISEVQMAGASSTDEFVELYNPTGSDVDISGWRLARKTQSGSDATDLVTSLTGSIPAQGYFLIASDSYDGAVTEDATYAAGDSSISTNNTILLHDGTAALVDKLGFGTATDFEADSEPNPTDNGSRERKALVTSTITSMTTGGSDEFLGNGEDTDNNENDFLSKTVSDPQNLQSNREPALNATASPTATASSTPAVSPSPTATAAPTVSPTLTPSPTASASPLASASPTATASPSPSATPTPSPTLTPSPSATPDITATPIATPSPTATAAPTIMPTKTPRSHHFPWGREFSCKVTYKTFHFRFFTMTLPLIFCGYF